MGVPCLDDLFGGYGGNRVWEALEGIDDAQHDILQALPSDVGMPSADPSGFVGASQPS